MLGGWPPDSREFGFDGWNADDPMPCILLHCLNLSGTGVTDTGLPSLMGLKQLQELNLSGTRITDEGVEKLRQALPMCQFRGVPPSQRP